MDCGIWSLLLVRKIMCSLLPKRVIYWFIDLCMLIFTYFLPFIIFFEFDFSADPCKSYFFFTTVFHIWIWSWIEARVLEFLYCVSTRLLYSKNISTSIHFREILVFFGHMSIRVSDMNQGRKKRKKREERKGGKKEIRKERNASW